MANGQEYEARRREQTAGRTTSPNTRMGPRSRISGQAAGGIMGGVEGNPFQFGTGELFQIAQLPILQMLGGLFPELQGIIGGLKQFRKFRQGGLGTEGDLPPFISPLEYGPFGSIANQFRQAQAGGRTALAGRGLLGSGAEAGFNQDLALQQALANQQARQQLMLQLPNLLNQVILGGRQGRLAKEQIGEAGGESGLAGLGGGLGAAAGLGLSAIPGIGKIGAVPLMLGGQALGAGIGGEF